MRRPLLLCCSVLCLAVLTGCAGPEEADDPAASATSSASASEPATAAGDADQAGDPAGTEAEDGEGEADGGSEDAAALQSQEGPSADATEEAALPRDESVGDAQTLAAWLDTAPRSIALERSSVVVFPGEDASLTASVKAPRVVVFVSADAAVEGSTLPGLIPVGSGQTRIVFDSPYSGTTSVLVRVAG